MNTLAALALLATPQGTIPPIQHVSGIVNLVANPGFESRSLSPWSTGGSVGFTDLDNPDGPTPASNPISGSVTGYGHLSSHCFKMNAGFPSFVQPYYGDYAKTYLRQDLMAQPRGGGIVEASVWFLAVYRGLTLTIEYTTGNPTVLYQYGSGDGWRKWDFLWAIDKTRNVKSLRFDAEADYGDLNHYEPFNDVFIDDATVSVWIRT